MKKLLNMALGYTVAAMVAGVFYREFTKFNNFTADTTLSVLHTHLFSLGMIIFLILALFALNSNLETIKGFNKNVVVYNIGVIGASILMFVRGVIQVLSIEISSAINASISGISGIFHIILAVGLIGIILSLRKIKKNN